MKQPESFLIKPPEKVKSPYFYLLKEVQEDIDQFPENIRPQILKLVEGKAGIEGNTAKAINKWWQEKYGFPFGIMAARNELLLRKHLPQTLEYEKSLQARLLKAMGEDDRTAVDKIKEEYKTQYPDQLEGIIVILALRNFLIKQKQFGKEGVQLNLDERKKRFRDFTEYQFLFTHFLVNNNHDKDFLDTFWKVAHELAEKIQVVHQLNVLRRGLLSQVAVYRITELLGQKPRLSHPDEDAFRAIDLWAENDQAIQIKGWEMEEPLILNSDHVAFPAIELQDGPDKNRHLNSRRFIENKNRDFLAKVSEYSEHTGKQIRGLMLIIPYSKIDFITGEPAPELVEFFKDKLNATV